MDLKAQLRLQEEMSRTEVERLKSEARTAQETLVERSRETARRLLAEKDTRICMLIDRIECIQN